MTGRSRFDRAFTVAAGVFVVLLIVALAVMAWGAMVLSPQ